MPKNRIQFSDDFVLNNNKVGIGSSAPQESLDVNSIAKGENLRVTGVSSISGYEGFLRSNHTITENTTLSSGQGITGSLSGEIIIGTGVTVTGFDVGIGTTTVGLGTTGTTTNALFPATTSISGQGQVESLKVYNTFTVPVGGTADRPTAPKSGMLFYNRDFATMEFWNGNVWKQVDNTTQSGRGVFAGGSNPAQLSSIDFVNISTTGNALNFGTLATANSQFSAASSTTRGFFGGYGFGGTVNNIIEYITISSQGNSIDFGDLTVSRRFPASCSSSTRGLIGGGVNPTSVQNVIDYITIATIGNALDFGDLTIARRTQNGSCSSPTRGVFLGGQTPTSTPAYQNVIEFVTISSTGNAVDFGDSLFAGGYRTGCSNTIRGLFGGGNAPAILNTIEYLTIATTGNAIYFGDLTISRSGSGACASQTRGVWSSGTLDGSTNYNTIDYVNISSTGNAVDFGDSTVTRNYFPGLSDSHGGLGGF